MNISILFIYSNHTSHITTLQQCAQIPHALKDKDAETIYMYVYVVSVLVFERMWGLCTLLSCSDVMLLEGSPVATAWAPT